MNDLLIRGMINNSILVNIINVILVLFLSKNIFLSASSLVSSIQYIVLIISLIMIAFTRNAQGLHDKVAKTEVCSCRYSEGGCFMHERKLTEQELVRRDKALKLRELGYDPFGSRYDRSDYANDVKEKYESVDHDAFDSMTDTVKVVW